ncbi:transcriptional regulator GutM [Maledivibacter halophilus]|uniref:DNA-binding transcriptional regulator of glucitol operon n=1 Tax=Maledivibacter halophilus TaxID=36842 RepID=A0A1T5LB12_9FIRM|nr:transcriptional regulator GutM [Maledivibacter halophilus]SKC73143.1 DNA-binding transcriptional regulator of glucitol operon [Maledivibacter halophilus]
MLKLLIIFMLGSVIQNFLFSKQLKTLNAFFYKLRTRGDVLVGKTKHIFKPGAIIMMLMDKDCIKEAYVLKGYSVFSKMKQLEYLEGNHLNDIDIDDSTIKLAFDDAVARFQTKY